MKHRFGGARLLTSLNHFVDTTEMVRVQTESHFAAMRNMVRERDTNSSESSEWFVTLPRRSLTQAETELR